MAIFNVQRVNTTFLCVALCIAAILMGFGLRSNGVTARSAPRNPQGSDEKVIDFQQSVVEPLEFNRLRVRNVSVLPNQKLSAKSLSSNGESDPGDWLENLQFNIANKSEKRVNFILLALLFPDTLVNGPMMVNHVKIGVPPNASVEAARYATPLHLEPGDKMSFTLSRSDFDTMKSFLALRRFKLADLNKVIIKTTYVIFDDDTKWERGEYYRPVPGRSGVYERVKQPIER